MASPSRRSSRKKARVSYDENVIKIHQEEQVEKPRRRRAPPKKRISSRAMLDEESTDSEEEEPVIRHAPKKRKKVANAKGRGPPSERTCPHCDQVCSSKAGLKYHVGKNKKDLTQSRHCFDHSYSCMSPPFLFYYI